MVSLRGIEEVETRIRSGSCLDRQQPYKAALTVNNKPSPRCERVMSMSQNTKEIPVWVGGSQGSGSGT